MTEKIRPAFTFTQAIRLCIYTIICPQKLEEEISEDDAYISSLPNNEQKRILKVRNAFWISFFLILGSGLLGLLIGLLLKCYVSPSGDIISLLQILGALFLLWGTLFVRGFEIQSYVCVTIAEKVNQWLYRFLYCLGTVIIIASLVLAWK